MAGTELQERKGTDVADRPRHVKLADFLMTKADDFKAVETVDSGKFLRVVKNAILRDPEIAEASSQSVYLECMKAMNDGLVLDGREAVLTRFRTNKRFKENGTWHDNWQIEVAYIPMVAGIMKRVRASGEIKAWTVELVYENEFKEGRFRYVAAPDPLIEHEPIIVGPRGPVVAAYSAVKLADGSHHYEVMNIDQLNAIKNRTKSKRTKKVNNQDVTEITGPWATDEEEMFRKTVIRRHSKRLPVSSATAQIASRVDALYDLDHGDVYDAETGEITPAKTGPKKSSAAGRLKKATAPKPSAAAAEPEEDEDPEHDGPVIEGEIQGPDDEGGNDAQTIEPGDEF